jgi:ubiquitin C-terminal hydrolase
LEDLDISCLLKLDENIPLPECTSYSLRAVVNHHGTLSGGHYTSFIKHNKTNQWYLCNDSSVRRVSSKEVLNSQAYILFYEKTPKRGKKTTSTQNKV